MKYWTTSTGGMYYDIVRCDDAMLIVFYSIRAVPAFPNLRRFPQGRGFKQWTGDDSKALMKVRTCPQRVKKLLIFLERYTYLRLKGMCLRALSAHFVHFSNSVILFVAMSIQKAHLPK